MRYIILYITQYCQDIDIKMSDAPGEEIPLASDGQLVTLLRRYPVIFEI